MLPSHPGAPRPNLYGPIQPAFNMSHDSSNICSPSIPSNMLVPTSGHLETFIWVPVLFPRTAVVKQTFLGLLHTAEP